MFVSPPNSYVEILTFNMMVLEGGAFGRELGHEGGALGNGFSALVNGTPKNSLVLIPPLEETMRSWESATRKKVLIRT